MTRFTFSISGEIEHKDMAEARDHLDKMLVMYALNFDRIVRHSVTVKREGKQSFWKRGARD